MSDVDRESHAINRKSVMDDGMGGRVVVIFRKDMVPCAGREVGQVERGGIPAFQTIVKNPPLADWVIRLPTEVVNPAVKNLLAFELNRLWRCLHPCRDIKIKSVGESIDLVRDGGLSAKEIPITERDSAGNGKLRGTPVLAR